LQSDAQVDAINRITAMQARPYLIEDERALVGVTFAAMCICIHYGLSGKRINIAETGRTPADRFHSIDHA
jgi:hypothetical protein